MIPPSLRPLESANVFDGLCCTHEHMPHCPLHHWRSFCTVRQPDYGKYKRINDRCQCHLVREIQILTANSLSGRNVPSVSMYKHFPSPPPWLTGNWHVTAIVWHNCVLPVRNSPNTSVIEPVSMPPPSNLSSSRDPVVNWMISERFKWNSVAVVNPIGTNFAASAIILSAFPSAMPLIVL